MQGAATVCTAFRFRPRGEVAVDACQKCLESAVANDFVDHLGAHGDEMIEESNTDFIAVNKRI
jgi:hypothetical protein